MSKHIPISFEFFPTKTDAGAEKLKVVHQELQLLNPELLNSMVKVHQLRHTYLVLATTKHVLLNYSTSTKIKALTVLSLYVAIYLLDKSV